MLFGFDPDGPLGTIDALAQDDGAIETNWAVRGTDPTEDAWVAPGFV